MSNRIVKQESFIKNILVIEKLSQILIYTGGAISPNFFGKTPTQKTFCDIGPKYKGRRYFGDIGPPTVNC
jgi:hypothetical protein